MQRVSYIKICLHRTKKKQHILVCIKIGKPFNIIRALWEKGHLVKHINKPSTDYSFPRSRCFIRVTNAA